ncbi:MAG: hypothetical protein DMF78_10870 [Acidobacteria bacterium]|nr:MAG: hypothetical protein DMF78_10870 [Acidobacteriota bacterium]
MKIKRRDFLRGAAAASGAALFGRATPSVGAGVLPGDKGLASLPPPETSGIEHIVVVMMENRSFDHFLGWLPNADGRTSRAAATPTPTTRMPAAACSETVARWTASCAPEATTNMPSGSTSRRIGRSTARWPATSRPSTARSAPSSARRFRTGSSSTRRRPIA